MLGFRGSGNYLKVSWYDRDTGTHTGLARTWDWGPSLYLAWAQLITARQSAVGPVPRAREDVSDGALSESCDTLRTLVQRCYMTLGCHYVKWQWYNNSRVTMMMMRVWPLASDIRDIIMSDRRSSILDMIRGRGKEAARRERDAPGLERWVLGSEDLMQSRVSFVHFDKLWCMWEKTPDTDNQQLQHLRPSFVHLYLWLLMQRP